MGHKTHKHSGLGVRASWEYKIAFYLLYSLRDCFDREVRNILFLCPKLGLEEAREGLL